MSISIGERLDDESNSDDESTQRRERAARRFVRVVDTYYTEPDNGPQRPLTYLCGRTFDGERAAVTLEGHRPYFLIGKHTYRDRASDLRDDRRVVTCTDADRRALDGTDLVRVTTVSPSHVADLREQFERTWEADVRYDQRVLTDLDVTNVVSVPSTALDTDGVTSTAGVHGVDLDDGDVPEPRVCYFDIEVEQTDEGPSVVSEDGIERAANTVTAISAYDSYGAEYTLDVLDHASWPDELAFDGDCTFRRHDAEYDLLRRFVTDLTERWQPDVVTAWNVGFDAPYLVNRCFETEVYEIQDLSPTSDVRLCNGDGSWINSSVTGTHVFDLLDGYEKTRYQSLDSYALTDVAATELDVDKLDVDEQDAYTEDPAAFCEYSLRDTELLVRLDTEVGIV
jgi:DNA polymerase elongation subunit (family B)